MTQTQLQRLHPDVAERTLRYRTARLKRLGLLGSSRPYRDAGSAPQHWWPTSAGQALATGEPRPRRGERRSPSPLTLAHTAAVSDLYVVLKTLSPDSGLTLHSFEREAWEEFDGGVRRITPDATVVLRGPGEKDFLIAHVEIDLGTMTHAQLRQKLGRYLAYTQEHAWRERFPFAPALLFVTTGRQRARTFLRSARSLARSKQWKTAAGEWELAVSVDARSLERTVAGARWADLRDDDGLSLEDCLRRARAPHDARRATRRAAQEARDIERTRLLRHPDALRQHLAHARGLRAALADRLERNGEVTLGLLLDGQDPLTAYEEDALARLGRWLGDRLPVDGLTPDVTDVDRTILHGVVGDYRRRQLAHVQTLTDEYGDLPILRRRDEELRKDDLLDHVTSRALDSDARHQAETRDEQAQRREAYHELREREARTRSRETSMANRLLRGHEPFLPTVDREWLRWCPRCKEVVYPRWSSETRRDAKPAGPPACAYCGSSAVRTLTTDQAEGFS